MRFFREQSPTLKLGFCIFGGFELGINEIAIAIEAQENLEAPKKVVRIRLRADFYESLTQSAVDNGFFGMVATGPETVEPTILGIPFVTCAQLQDFALELE